jgi:outer membrane receptor for ferrienterochelin and colicins
MWHDWANLKLPPVLIAICIYLLPLSVHAQVPDTRPSAGASTQPTTLSSIAVPPAAKANPSLGNKALTASDLADLGLEQLMQVQVTTDTLTATQRQLVPAAVTTIDNDQIEQQNPRTLNNLLNIYVPNLEESDHPFELPSIGIRGIIGDDNTKYLTLVDGREMNERTHFGSLTEQDLYLLGDIQQVDVVRGPGSATYGPGAVEGVISMQTFNGLNYQGTDATIRGGALDEFIDAEFKHGEKLTADSGWFIYGGAAQVTGADASNAPIVEGQDFTATDGTVVQAGKPVIDNFGREGAEYEGQPQIKAHAEYDNGGLSIWTRYTRGGEELDPTDRTWGEYPAGFGYTLPPERQAVGYEQLTGFIGDKIGLADDLELDVSTSIDFTDYERIVNNAFLDSHQEDKSISKALLNWQMSRDNQLAIGSEYQYYWLGLPSWFDPGLDGLDSAFTTPQHWRSDLFSFFTEDQWHFAKQLTLFLSVRADKDKFTNWLYSPRAAVAWEPDDKDTLKFIASQSLRTNTEEFMYAQWLNNHKLSDPETMNSLELRYERQQTNNLFLASSLYYNRLAAIDWDGHEEELLGAYKTAGVEVEASYRTKSDDITLSNGFTKLVGQNFHPDAITLITSAPYGFGYDLNDWSDDVTKLSAYHKLNDHLSIDGNIQAMWGYRGSLDYLDYKDTMPYFSGGPTDGAPGYKQPFGTTAYLNLGTEYKFDEHQSLRFDVYNILGWFDYRLNKDDVLGPNWSGNYRVQSPAVAVTYRFTF